MNRIQGNGWLLVGVLGALLSYVVPRIAAWQHALGLPDSLAWPGLVLAVCTSVHFRAHWVATLHVLRQRERRQQALRRRLREALDEATRSAWLVSDNLREIDTAALETSKRLYFEGAEAHAHKGGEALTLIGALLDGRVSVRPGDDG